MSSLHDIGTLPEVYVVELWPGPRSFGTCPRCLCCGMHWTGCDDIDQYGPGCNGHCDADGIHWVASDGSHATEWVVGAVPDLTRGFLAQHRGDPT